MKMLLSIIIGLALFQLITGCAHLPYNNQSRVETGWMSLSELNAYLAKFDIKEKGKNYWDQGHWIDTAEGRWKNGIPQYRLRHSAVPPNNGYWWYWWFNQDQESFSKHVHEMADQGMTLVYHQSFVRPDGVKRYQGVWHKIHDK